MRFAAGTIPFGSFISSDAISHYKQSLKASEDMKDPKGIVPAANRIGAAYSNWGNYEEAYTFLNQAMDVAKKNNMFAEMNAISKNIETVKKNLNNFQKSQTEYAQLKDKEKQTQIQSLSAKNIKSMVEIEQLSDEAQLKELKIKTQQE